MSTRPILIAAFAALSFAGCDMRPRYNTGDHLIPLGSSDPSQIVTVTAVEKDGYRVTPGVAAGQANAAQFRTRKEIESYYVRVADLPVGGSWATATPTPTPTPKPTPASTPAAEATATAAPSTPAPQPLDLERIAATARTAIVRVLLFDGADKPMKPAIGCLISADGRLVASAAAVERAANALIELRSGAMKNVSGLLASSAESGLAVLQANVSGAPFLPVASVPPQIGAQVAIVGPADPREKTAFAATVAAAREEAGGMALQLSGADLRAQAGSPVFNQGGEIVAFVTVDERGSSLNSVRSVAALSALLGQIAPNAVAKWPAQSPTPAPRASPSPSAHPLDAVLVYTPYPRYPAAARFSFAGPRVGSGQYLIQFGSDGAAQKVSVLRSTGNPILDQAAVDALKSWRAQRGRPSQKIVPITFR